MDLVMTLLYILRSIHSISGIHSINTISQYMFEVFNNALMVEIISNYKEPIEPRVLGLAPSLLGGSPARFPQLDSGPG